MYKSLIVIDDFMKKPDVLWDLAVNAEYSDIHPDSEYPGRNSKYPQVIDGLDEAISNIVGEKLVSIPTQGTSQAKFRITLDGEEGNGGVHIDNCHWTAILYLTKPEYCQGGTDFFRHKPTNTEHAPLIASDLEKFGFEKYEDVWDKLINVDGKDPNKWERTGTVPMRYNRLVLLRPWQWHNATPGFGTTIENGRLIYMSFLNNPNGLSIQQ
jgi:hypothetical protein